MPRRAAPACALFAAVLAACAPLAPPPSAPAVARTHLTATATVLDVDPGRRVLRLRDPASRAVFLVPAQAEPMEIAALRRGDTVMLDYFASLSLAPAPPGADGAPLTMAGDAPAAIGQRPGGISVGATSGTATFLSYLPAEGLALVQDESGRERGLPVPPSLRAFVERLAPGERILVTLTEAVSLSVTPLGD